MIFEEETQNGAANDIGENKKSAIEKLIDMGRNIIGLCKNTACILYVGNLKIKIKINMLNIIYLTYKGFF